MRCSFSIIIIDILTTARWVIESLMLFLIEEMIIWLMSEKMQLL